MRQTIDKMVEAIVGGENSDNLFWIYDDDEGGLCWSPGTVVDVRADSYVLECIVSGDHFEIEKKESSVVHPSCLGKLIFLCQL